MAFASSCGHKSWSSTLYAQTLIVALGILVVSIMFWMRCELHISMNWFATVWRVYIVHCAIVRLESSIISAGRSSCNGIWRRRAPFHSDHFTWRGRMGACQSSIYENNIITLYSDTRSVENLNSPSLIATLAKAPSKSPVFSLEKVDLLTQTLEQSILVSGSADMIYWYLD